MLFLIVKEVSKGMSEQPIIYRSYGEEQEIAALKQKIEELEKGRRPVLPRKVAVALEKVKKELKDLEIEHIAWRIAQSSDNEFYEDDSEDLKYLRHFADSASFFALVDALRYGYTIAPPTEFTPSRKMFWWEIFEIRRLYSLALSRKKAEIDDGLAFEAIDKAILYLGGTELIADIKEGGADE